MSSYAIKIVADTVNGEILEFPLTVDADCLQVIAIGPSVVRDFDANFCVVAKSVFLVQFGQNVFGTTQFSTIEEFNSYRDSVCVCCDEQCEIGYDDCALKYDSCLIKYIA